MDFDTARQTVQRELDRRYNGERESPRVRAYGFDAGPAFAPLIDWDGVMGAYVFLVNKRTGSLTPQGFADFDTESARRVGAWPQ